MSNSQGNRAVDAIRAAGVAELLAKRHAIVLERIARGAGRTRWYWVRSSDDLERLCGLLLPGSVVSFYFDNRIQRLPRNDEAEVAILDLVADHGDAVVGRLGEDDLELLVDFVAGPNELAELLAELKPAEQLFIGAFPVRDNDATDAVTVVLPDDDGEVREQPH